MDSTSLAVITASSERLQKKGNLGLDISREEAVGAAEQDVGLDPDLQQFLHAMLGGLLFNSPAVRM